MQSFKYYSAKTIEECLEFLSEKKGIIKTIAGGTDLIPALRQESIVPDHILNIMEVPELTKVKEDNSSISSISIGPAVTFQKIIDSAVLQREIPLVCLAAMVVGSPQIRNRGTVGGNIITASPCADVVPALVALDGTAELRSKAHGKRTLTIESLLKSAYDVQIRPDELLTGISINKLSPGTRFGFEKIGRRNSLARARMSMAIVLTISDDNTVSFIRIVPGAVMPAPKRITAAEELICGKKITDNIIAEAGEIIASDIINITGIRESADYKIPVVKNLFKRVFKSLL